MNDMTKATRINDLRRVAFSIGYEHRDDLFDSWLAVLPEVSDTVWSKAIKLAEAEKTFPTRQRFARLLQEAAKGQAMVQREARIAAEIPERTAADEAYAYARMALIQRLLAGIGGEPVRPTDVAVILRGIAADHPQHAAAIAIEIRNLETCGDDWQVASMGVKREVARVRPIMRRLDHNPGGDHAKG